MSRADDDLEALAAAGSHAYDDGCRPRSVPPPHVVLAAAIEAQGVDLDVVLSLIKTMLDVLVDSGLVPAAGALTPAALAEARREVQAANAVDHVIGLTGGRLNAEGLTEPLATALARAEAAHPCCGGHHPKETTP
jgi:hypothetical protein